MWQVSLGLKEDEMGSQTPHYVEGGAKNYFRYFLVSGSHLSSFNPDETCTYLYILYIYVASLTGLKEDEEGSPQRL